MRTTFWQKINIELMAWPLGLILLYMMKPDQKSESLCLLKRAGIPFCPGCGLGHGIHYFLHGQWDTAIRHHWLSPLVVVVLLYRIIQLARLQYTDLKQL
ncbi:DUF2752 domain-containing protein [Chitinophaga polysaccharea]|uniref:DUF2752 domain-containing protein n=1 Tax=Chitinophaga polysaccharea TaxID=1293035 RepID=UPI0011A44371|nr:DUF2752 domain-containing protein [Chitinophaga polysaccharea]